jgi:hypothetical protein
MSDKTKDIPRLARFSHLDCHRLGESGPRLAELAQSVETPLEQDADQVSKSLVREQLTAALRACEKGYGSYGPHYDGDKLAHKIQELVTSLK